MTDVFELVLFRANGLVVSLWNLTNKTIVKTLVGHTGSITSLKEFKNGLLTSDTGDHSVRLWNITSGESISISPDTT